ncbi:MAG: hypothetical protein ACRC10_01340 [Thermoguttaceae bacterium]
MSDKMRWRYGETNPVIGVPSSNVLIEIGDLVIYDSDTVLPASSTSKGSDKTATQTACAAKFLGVAMQRSAVGDVAPIRIATTGVFEMDCKSKTFVLGSLIGVSDKPDGTLFSQEVDLVTTNAAAIARVVRREPKSTKTILIGIKSAITEGGIK